MHDEVALLSAEHDAVQRLLRELHSAGLAGDIALGRAAARALREALTLHADREERGVFAELRDAGVGDAYVSGFEADHLTIRGLLDRIPEDMSAVAELERLLADHILREESDLFPAAHQLLAPEQWDAIAARMPTTTTALLEGAHP
jgi:hemerythrin-like domain-containing protein